MMKKTPTPEEPILKVPVAKGRQGITEHEGNKYLRDIFSADGESQVSFSIDVYCVLKAFEVTCPARQQAIKKLLCAGLRGKGNTMADLVGAMAALNRAIDIEQQENM